MVSFYSNGLSVQKDDSSKVAKIEVKNNDTSQYELIVFDPAYETFLITQPPMNFYSESYYRTWNTQYVNIWNDRYLSQTKSGLYENSIDYDPTIGYGLELEYKLYYFFRFFEKKNHISLIPRGN